MANTFAEDLSTSESVPRRFKAQPTSRPVGSPPFSDISLSLAERTFLGKRNEWALGASLPYPGPIAVGGSPTGGYVFTNSGTGTGAITFGTNGEWILTSGTTDEDFTQLQNTTLITPFYYSTTKTLRMFIRAKVLTAATTDFFFGLAPVDTSLISASALAITDGIVIFKAATATDVTASVVTSSTATSKASGMLTIAADTYFVVGIVVEGGVVRLYAQTDPNDVVRTAGFSTGTVLVAAAGDAHLPATTTALYPSLLVGQEGGTTARVLTVDWAFISQQRA